MRPGYAKPLYLLPFDHRHSYESGMFGFTPPLSPLQHAKVADSKRVIYEGFTQAVADGVPPAAAGILVDEEFGASILRDAASCGYTRALSTEKSGVDEFEFEYGDAFAAHIDKFHPTFAKALVRYNPQDDAALNARQAARLELLSDYCRGGDTRFMFELLVPATKAQLARVGNDAGRYDREIRPGLMIEAMRALQDAGVEPDVWKIEGLDRRADCAAIVDVARRDGRAEVGCIVLGRGADERRVVGWLEVAASVRGFIGFAVGRTTFWDAIAGFEAGKLSRAEAATQVARRYAEWTAIFTGAGGRRASP
jgi:myo-inositol catabolism protein IolC